MAQDDATTPLGHTHPEKLLSTAHGALKTASK